MTPKLSTLIIVIPMLISLNINYVCASPKLTLIIQTNKQTYNVQEKIVVSGNLTLDGSLVTDALIGVQINDPSDTPILYRTFSTGDTPLLREIEILNVYPCDDIGNPQYSFQNGTLANFKITVKNNNPEPRYVLLTLTLFYEPFAIPFEAIVFFEGYVEGGKTKSFIPSIPIPSDAMGGLAKVYCSAFSALPSQLGRPYCPEFSANFMIMSSETSKGVEGQAEYSQTPGTYKFAFEIHEQAPPGSYVIYASTKYGRETAFAYTTFNVIHLPRVKVNPRVNIMQFNESVSVAIEVTDVANLTSWEVKIYYNSTMLNATQTIEGSFLSNIGTTIFEIYQFTDSFNSTHGIVWANCSLTSRNKGANGNGILATITFKAKTQEGISIVHLEETKLADNGTPPTYIPHTAVNGIFVIGIHNVAIIDVAPYKTIVGMGSILPIRVSVKNNGQYAESFNLTIYVNNTSVQTITIINLEQFQLLTFKIYWNTTGFFIYQNYTMSAYAVPVPNEINYEDNTFIDGNVMLVIQGDINVDKIVDIFDAVLLAGAAGSMPGSLNWDPKCDLNNDEIVDIFDAVILSANAGKNAL